MWIVQCSMPTCAKDIELLHIPKKGTNYYCNTNCKNRFKKKRGLRRKRDCSSDWYRSMLNNTTCHYCFKPATTRDHIIPFGLGGPTRLWNMVPACEKCNNVVRLSQLPTCACAKCRSALVWYELGYASI